MFRVVCCKKKIKCRIWVLADSKCVLKTLKQAICPICSQKIAVVEKFYKEGAEPARTIKFDDDAEELIEKVSCDILYELMPLKSNQRHGFYLNYSEYGRIKKCFSNLSALKLGLVKSNFEDLENTRITA